MFYFRALLFAWTRLLSSSYSSVLAISYRGFNPIPYETFQGGCSRQPDQVVHYGGFWRETTGSIQFMTSATDEFACRRFAVQVYLEDIGE